MNKLVFWVRLSNISAVIGITIGIIMRFFENRIANFIPFILIAVLSIFTYLLSEIFKFIIKKRKNDI